MNASSSVPPAGPRPTTLASIAREAGVHAATVSRILNSDAVYKRPSFAKRAALIRALAEKHGYRPNQAARAVVTQRFGAVALLQHAHHGYSYLPQALLLGIEAALEERGSHLCLERCAADDLEDPACAPRILRRRHVDGLLVNLNSGANPILHGMLAQHRIPSVWLNTRLTADCVYGDDRGAAEDLTRHLLAAGFRDLHYLGLARGGKDEHYSKVDRCAGYQAALAAAGIEEQSLTVPIGSPLGPALLERLARPRGSGPQVWITYSRRELEFLLPFACGRAGLRLGSDLLLATFTESTLARGLCVAQMLQPLESLGRASVAMLAAKIAGPDQPLPPLTIPWTLHLKP